MKFFVVILFVLMFMDLWSPGQCKRGGGGSSWGRRGSSRGKSTSSSSTSSSGGGWFSWSKSNHAPSAPPAPKPAAPAPKPSYGWSAPQPKPAVVAAPAHNPSYGWTKPAQTPGVVAPPPKPATGWQSGNKAAPNSNAPSSNIGPGGYPVQGGMQRNPPPYSPTNTHVNPPPYSPTNTHGTSFNNKPYPPAYSPTNPHSPPAYSGPKKQVINNHYHYNSPPAYSQPSHFGMGQSYYPSQNSFGYPGGNSFFGTPKYNGMGLFGGGGSYGYSGSGGWGQPSYGFGRSSSSGGMVKGLLIGAAGGYLANSLIRRITNPWGYSGHGYGYGYMDRYRSSEYDRYRTTTMAPPPENNWINCVAYDPQTNSTLINPNCTCSVSVITDPVTGVNTSHHDCTPYGMTPPPGWAPQQPLPVYGVNNPPPSFNGSLYNADGAYGGAYGAGTGYGGGQPAYNEGVVLSPDIRAGAVSEVNSSPLVTTEGPPKSEQQIASDDVVAKRSEFYSKLESMVNMGRFRS